MSADVVMLLIDADNVSLDVMEQALADLMERHGAVHLRRAYCTAESAVKHQTAFKRLGIRPCVNLAAGKNSTDIALAVDAIDLVLAERPDIVAIASSDSDFAPLVGRLREKGCRVVGIGQEGKTGDETRAVYDDYTVFAHRSGSSGAARTAARKAAPRKAAAKKAVAKKAPAKKAAARKTTRAAPAAEAAVVDAPPSRTSPPPPPPPPAAATADDRVARILAVLTELADGRTLELGVAAKRLRDAGLLTKNASSTRLFAPFADRFELMPAAQPNRVRLR